MRRLLQSPGRNYPTVCSPGNCRATDWLCRPGTTKWIRVVAVHQNIMQHRYFRGGLSVFPHFDGLTADVRPNRGLFFFLLHLLLHRSVSDGAMSDITPRYAEAYRKAILLDKRLTSADNPQKNDSRKARAGIIVPADAPIDGPAKPMTRAA